MTTRIGKTAKRLAALLFSAMLAAALLTGCGQAKQEEQAPVRIGALKGPTSMGLLFLQQDAADNKADGTYEFTMMTAADELLALIVKGELDIALLPANVAGVLYQKTDGGITVIDINTLGVLYMVSGDTSIDSVEKLRGRTIYLTGKGTTPDYVLQYVLRENGIAVGDADGCMLEYKSEAAEVAAVLAENPGAVGLLPQPFATAACVQNKALTVVLDMNAQWEAIQGAEGGRLVTGVTVVRNDFLQANEAAVKTFLKEHEKSAGRINEMPEEGARLAVEAGIVAKEPIALRAIPQCNITYIDGAQMKQALSGYLQVLYEYSPEAVGGGMPGDDFYYE